MKLLGKEMERKGNDKLNELYILLINIFHQNKILLKPKG